MQSTRGTRVYEGKDFFTIRNFVKACENFNDPEWGGEPDDPIPPPGVGENGNGHDDNDEDDTEPNDGGGDNGGGKTHLLSRSKSSWRTERREPS